MKRCIVILLAALAWAAAGKGAFAEGGVQPREFTVEVVNKTPDTELSRVIVETPSHEEIEFQPLQETNAFTHVVKFSQEQWFYPVDIKLTWKIPAASGSSEDEFHHRFSLLLRPDYPYPKYVVPVFYEETVTRHRMDEIDQLTNPKDQFQVFFSTYRIYAHYRSTAPNSITGGFAKRVSNKLFEAAKALALEEHYLFVMNEDARQWVLDSYKGTGDAYDRYVNLGWDAASLYWYDLARIDSLTSDRADRAQNCKFARSLISDLQRIYESPAGRTAFRFRHSNNSDALAQAQKLLNGRCGN